MTSLDSAAVVVVDTSVISTELDEQLRERRGL